MTTVISLVSLLAKPKVINLRPCKCLNDILIPCFIFQHIIIYTTMHKCFWKILVYGHGLITVAVTLSYISAS